MQHENIKKDSAAKEGGYGVAVRAPGVRAESSGDHVLPDYRGEVKRVLLTRARPISAGVYEREGECSFSGIVEHLILYSDAEDRLGAETFTSDYDFSLKVSDGVSSPSARTSVANYAVRLQGPRKMSVKASLLADVIAPAARAVPYPEADGLYTRRETVKRHVCRIINRTEREYAEEGSKINGILAEDVEVIAADAVVRVDKAFFEDNAIVAKGVITASAVLSVCGETVMRTEKDIPFEQIIGEASADEADAVISAHAQISSVSVGINEIGDDSQEQIGSQIVFSVCADFSCALDRNEEAEIITDAYADGCECAVKWQRLDYNELAGSLSAERELRLFGAKGDSGSSLGEIIFKDYSVQLVSVKAEGGAVTFCGECRLSAVCSGGGEERFVPVKLASPFEISAKHGSLMLPEGCEIIPEISVSEIAALIDGDGIRADVRLRASCRIVSSKSISCVSDVECAEPVIEAVSHPEIVAYYHEKDECLWDIAKKYKKDPRSVARDNSIDIQDDAALWNSEALEGLKCLIIN